MRLRRGIELNEEQFGKLATVSNLHNNLKFEVKNTLPQLQRVQIETEDLEKSLEATISKLKQIYFEVYDKTDTETKLMLLHAGFHLTDYPSR